MLTLGFDVGSSSVKAALLDAESGASLGSAFSPKEEMPIQAPHPGWAEQDPATWWDHLARATHELLKDARAKRERIGAIGISYQMHGLVTLDRAGAVLRPSIIWCDSRATEIGREAFDALGHEACLKKLLNSPGNFTLSKLRWMKLNEGSLFDRVATYLLPGDYIAYRLTGRAATTVSGLSEGMGWDFSADAPAAFLLAHYGIPAAMVAATVPTFGEQGHVTAEAAAALGIPAGIPVTYRAGDQPNNALSLNVLEPGEVAATGGTSGVVYAINSTLRPDPESRVNAFAHVNHEGRSPRIGVLLCINGCGIANSWTRRMTGNGAVPYEELNARAAGAPPGSGGMRVYPFGNGAERMFGDREIGAHIASASYTTHGEAHLLRAVQEGIAFSFRYGMEIMTGLGIVPSVIRAGDANLFKSRLFCETLANTAGVAIELYNTDGALGAARGAALGAHFYASPREAFAGLARRSTIEPDARRREEFADIYGGWLHGLKKLIERA